MDRCTYNIRFNPARFSSYRLALGARILNVKVQESWISDRSSMEGKLPH